MEDMIFISYSHKDSKEVKKIAEIILETTGKKVWYDTSLRGGEHYFSKIANQIAACSYFVFVVSDNSVHSDWCKRELEFAANENKRIIAVWLENIDIDPQIRLIISSTHYVTYNPLNRKQFLEDIQRTFDVKNEDIPPIGSNKTKNSNSLLIGAIVVLAVLLWVAIIILCVVKFNINNDKADISGGQLNSVSNGIGLATDLSNDEIIDFYKKAQEQYYDWLTFDCDYIDTDSYIEADGKTFYLVHYAGISSVADLTAHLSNYFVPEFFKDTVEEYYIDYNGKLYRYTNAAGDGGLVLLSYEFTRTDESTYTLSFVYGEYDRRTNNLTTSEPLTFSLIFRDGKWVFAEDFSPIVDMTGYLFKYEGSTVEVILGINDMAYYVVKFKETKMGRVYSGREEINLYSDPSDNYGEVYATIGESEIIPILGINNTFDEEWLLVQYDDYIGFVKESNIIYN